MAHFAAYVGTELKLDQFLLEPAARAGNALVPHHAGAGGFGLGWYAPDNIPAIFTSDRALWTDPNAPHLGRSLTADLWFAHLATLEPDASQITRQPLCDDELMFICSGEITDFAAHVRPSLREYLEPGIEAEIDGGREPEHLFALVRHLLASDEEITVDQALAELASLVGAWAERGPFNLTLAVTDGERIYGMRHAIGEDSMALYYAVDDPQFPEGQACATLPLTNSDFWQLLPERHILILDPESPPELTTL